MIQIILASQSLCIVELFLVMVVINSTLSLLLEPQHKDDFTFLLFRSERNFCKTFPGKLMLRGYILRVSPQFGKIFKTHLFKKYQLELRKLWVSHTSKKYQSLDSLFCLDTGPSMPPIRLHAVGALHMAKAQHSPVVIRPSIRDKLLRVKVLV